MKKIDKFEMCRNPAYKDKVFDAVVIGGGSGGISFTNEAEKLGMDVAIFDYVTESPYHGTKWGLGGTCVNVGCIPKKLYHNAAIIKDTINKSNKLGYEFDDLSHDWDKMMNTVKSHIKRLNFDYQSNFSKQSIPYLNAYASLYDQNTVLFSPEPQQIWNFLNTGKIEDPSKVGQLKANNIIIATGGRPKILTNQECPGSKYAITSDDLFFLPKRPKRVLVIGGGYIACETASFMSKLGCKVELAARSVYLRGFDRDCVDFVIGSMGNLSKNITIKSGLIPTKIVKNEDGSLTATLSDTKTKRFVSEGTYDCIVQAVTRTPCTDSQNQNELGIKTSKETGKILGMAETGPLREQTSVSNIWAVGDVLEGIPEQTPVASKSGALLAKRLEMIEDKSYSGDFSALPKNLSMDYDKIPSTIYTYPEYGLVGLSEEEVKDRGLDYEVYHKISTPLEQALCDRDEEKPEKRAVKNYFKLICAKDEKETVLGLHYVGVNSGEVIQGFATAMKMGMTKEDQDSTVGIHPTVAEDLVSMNVTKRSGDNPEKSSC